jgi:hypothetical protein
MRRFLWLALLALGAGFALGLCYAWIISPIRYLDATPNTLRSDFKDEFRTAIAASYAATHNLGRARARLALLGDADPVQALTAQAQRMLANGDAFDIVQEVAGLAADMRNGVASLPTSATVLATVGQEPAGSTAAPAPSATMPPTEYSTESAAQTPSPPAAASAATIISTALVFDTPTPRPTRTPVPTAGAPYQLATQDKVCHPDLTDGLMQVVVFDSLHRPVPGVEMIITYTGAEEHFFTGLKPELGDGYADYIMQVAVIYTLRVGQSGTPVLNLSAPACPDTNGQTYTGGLKLTFQQP